ncbi:acetyl-CoA carboxylase biotin carboxyl carrier protein subunit [Sneathiella sp. HT1-7]|nr:acetyl-CoA carboxylase biotin carboxyl carrier protein subunit [Sneathiella sp. HT1-7]
MKTYTHLNKNKKLNEGMMALIDVVAEVAGKVWKVEAEVGQKLDEEDDIVILESMKMEIPVGAPADGTLKEILVGEGDAVAEDQVIARIEA